MKRKLLTSIALIVLCIAALTVAVNSGRAQRQEFESPQLPSSGITSPVNPAQRSAPLPTDCALQPTMRSPGAGRSTRSAQSMSNFPVTLDRFRRLQPLNPVAPDASKQRSGTGYTPPEEIVLIHPTNYGDRFLLDVNGNPANQKPIVVLHETVASAHSTLNFFLTAHPRDEDQASYHTLIRRDGSIVYLVPPDKRAFGAGNSVFNGPHGPEAVRTHARFPASVNNFAYHVSLETPADGIDNAPGHSGYTEAQYQSLAWLVAKTGVADDRITTHKAVDRSASRMDPRSFRFSRFFQLLQTYTKTNEIVLQCTIPPNAMRSQRPTGATQSAAKSAAKSKVNRPTATRFTAPKPTAPKPTAPKSTATQSTASKSTTPKPTTSKPTAPKSTATQSTASKSTTPKLTGSKLTAPRPDSKTANNPPRAVSKPAVTQAQPSDED